MTKVTKMFTGRRTVSHRLAVGGAVAMFALLGACGKKADDGGGGDDAKPTKSSTTTGGAGDGGTTSNPCLRLDDMGTTGTSGPNVGGSSDCGGGSTSNGGAMGTTEGGGAATGAATEGGMTTASPTTGSATTGGGGGGGTWSPGPGIAGCHDQKKIWQAVVNSGSGQCGDEEYTDICCNDPANFLNAFPTIKDKLQPSITTMQTNGLVFYGCSKNADKFTLYAAKYSAGSISYQTVYVTGATPVLTGQPASCTAKTLADIGYTAPATTTTTGSGTTTGATDGGTTTGGTGTGTVPPAALCGLSDTSQAGMRGWLANTANYATYKQNATLAATKDQLHFTHGKKVRVYNNQALADSFTAGNATQPQCSVAVVDEFDDNSVRTGTSVAIKFQAAASGDSWLFYQSQGGTLAAPTTENYGVGRDACKACHATVVLSPPQIFTDYAAPVPP